MYCLECKRETTSESGVCEACGKALNLDSDRYFRTGMDAMASGDLDLAIALLNSSVDLHPGHLSARYNLGIALSLANKCEESMEQLVVVAREDPKYPGIYTALGQATFGSYMVHTEEAEWARQAMVQLFMKAIEQDPEDVDAYFSLGNAYIAVDMADKAVPWLRHALSLHPDSPAICFLMAKAFSMQNQYRDAAAMAQRSMELASPDDPFRDEIEGLFRELQERVTPI